MFDTQVLYQTLTEIKGSLAYILPELVLSGGILLLVLLDLFLPAFKRVKTWFVLGVLLGLGALLTSDLMRVITALSLFQDSYSVAATTQFLKLVAVAAVVLFIAFLASGYHKRTVLEKAAEYEVLVLTILLAAFVAISSRNLLLTILGIETISLCSYLLLVFSEEKTSAEAGFKYLMFGAISGGLLIYGVSLLYLETSSLSVVALLHYSWVDASIWGLAGAFCVSLGLLFKLGAVPMHLWMPDVYNGASFPLISFIAVLPKLVAVYLLFLFSSNIEWGLLLTPKVYGYLALVAMLSITIGNLSALWQKSSRRLMAYSGIAHAGFLLVGVVAGNAAGWQATLFYFIAYVFMNVGALMLLSYAFQLTGNDRLESLSGLGKSYPLLGGAAVLVFISLIGIPPSVGFTAKVFIFSSLWPQVQQGETYVLVLFVVGLINTVVGLFYYIKIPYFMFFKSRKVGENKKLNAMQELFLLAICLPLLLLFIWPSWLLSIIENLI